MSEDGALVIRMKVDTSGYDEGIKRMESEAQGLSAAVESETAKISALMHNIPKVDLQITARAGDLQQIEAALQEVDRVVDANTKGVRELNERYRELGRVRQELAAKGQKGSSYDTELAKERKAIQEVIKVREQAIEEAGRQGDALLKLEAQLKTQQAAVEQNAQSQGSLRQRLRELKMELVEMEASGQRGTAAYRALQEETARLTDAWGDAQAQATILANDQRGFAGVMSGLTGLSGAFGAATGAVALFGSENEDLQKIMVKLQSVMAITMGLQQVQQTLNKDSAFSLVTLNGLKEWWNKLLAVGAGEQVAETAATVADTAAEEANTVATGANAAAHEAKAAAETGAAAATAAETAATGANSGAAATGAVANIGLAGAFRMVGAAIKSIPVFGWIAAAIGVLIGVISHFVKKANETSEAVKQKNEMLKDARKIYAQARMELDDYRQSLEEFNGTQKEEKQLVEELNKKYGEHMGYCSSVSEWKERLVNKSEAYCQMLMMEAEAQAVLAKATDAYIALLEVQEKAKSKEYDHWWNTKLGNEKARQAKIDEAKAEVDKWQNLYMSKRSAIRSFAKENGLGGHTSTSAQASSSSRSAGGSYSSGPAFDPKEAARREKEALENWRKAVEDYVKDANESVASTHLQYMQEGLEKELEQSRMNTEALKEEWRGSMMELSKARKQYARETYMAGKGATEEGWLASAAGKKSDEDYLQELLTDPQYAELATQYNAQLEKIEADGVRERLRIQQDYQDALVEKYGTTAEKIEVLERRYFNSVLEGAVPDEYLGEAERQLRQQISELATADLKKSINWEDVFGNLDAVATASLKTIGGKLKEFLKLNKGELSPEALKTIVEAIQKIEDKLDERNPFKAMCSDFGKLMEATKALSEAQREYNRLIEEGTQEEQENAEKTLQSARNARQKALAESTKSMKAASQFAKDLLGIGTAITDCLGSFGVEIPAQISGFLTGIGKVVDSLGSIDLTKPLSVIKGAVGIVGGLASAIGSLFNHDAAKEKRIQKLQDQIEALDKAYSSLAKEIEKAYSTDASKLIEQNNVLLEQKRALIQQQIEEEKSKKKTDDSRIEEWENQLAELDEQIAELKEQAVDAIFGDDLKSAIEDFASAYADAWENGEDRAKSAKDTVRSMMRQMVTESIKAAIQSSAAMERIREQLNKFYEDEVLDAWEQEYVMNMAEQLQRELDEQFGWASSLLKGTSSQQSGSSGAFQAMSEDTAQELNGRFTALQIAGENTLAAMIMMAGDTALISSSMPGVREGMAEIQNIGLLQLAQLETINKNTRELYEMNDKLEKIRRNTQNI